MANKKNEYTLEQQQEFINKANEMYKNGANKTEVLKELGITGYALDEAVKNLNYQYVQKPCKGYAPKDKHKAVTVEELQEAHNIMKQEEQEQQKQKEQHEQPTLNSVSPQPINDIKDIQQEILNRKEFNVLVNLNPTKGTSIRLYTDTMEQLDKLYKLHPEKKNQDILNTIIVKGIESLLK